MEKFKPICKIWGNLMFLKTELGFIICFGYDDHLKSNFIPFIIQCLFSTFCISSSKSIVLHFHLFFALIRVFVSKLFVRRPMHSRVSGLSLGDPIQLHRALDFVTKLTKMKMKQKTKYGRKRLLVTKTLFIFHVYMYFISFVYGSFSFVRLI